MQRNIVTLHQDCESFFSVIYNDIFNTLLLFLPNSPRVAASNLRYRKRWRMHRINPKYFCVDNDDNLIVITGYHSLKDYRINVYDSRTGIFVRQIGQYKERPTAVAVDYKGTYYVAFDSKLLFGKTEYRLDPMGKNRGIALRKDHLTIYVAHSICIREISVFSGNVLQTYFTNFYEPTDIAVATDIIVSTQLSGRIYFYNDKFQMVNYIHLSLQFNNQIAVDVNDYIYICCADNVKIIDAARQSLVGIVGKNGSKQGQFHDDPHALAILRSGTLVVGANQLRTIQFFR